eukprot:6210030-Pleurochrysis_carterae.AAC.2
MSVSSRECGFGHHHMDRWQPFQAKAFEIGPPARLWKLQCNGSGCEGAPVTKLVRRTRCRPQSFSNGEKQQTEKKLLEPRRARAVEPSAHRPVRQDMLLSLFRDHSTSDLKFACFPTGLAGCKKVDCSSLILSEERAAERRDCPEGLDDVEVARSSDSKTGSRTWVCFRNRSERMRPFFRMLDQPL